MTRTEIVLVGAAIALLVAFFSMVDTPTLSDGKKFYFPAYNIHAKDNR